MLSLIYDKSRRVYLIDSQHDLYQINEWLKFLKFILPGVWILVLFWQFLATFLSIVGTWVFWPVTWYEENAMTDFGALLK